MFPDHARTAWRCRNSNLASSEPYIFTSKQKLLVKIFSVTDPSCESGWWPVIFCVNLGWQSGNWRRRWIKLIPGGPKAVQLVALAVWKAWRRWRMSTKTGLGPSAWTILKLRKRFEAGTDGRIIIFHMKNSDSSKGLYIVRYHLPTVGNWVGNIVFTLRPSQKSIIFHELDQFRAAIWRCWTNSIRCTVSQEFLGLESPVAPGHSSQSHAKYYFEGDWFMGLQMGYLAEYIIKN